MALGHGLVKSPAAGGLRCSALALWPSVRLVCSIVPQPGGVLVEAMAMLLRPVSFALVLWF